MAITILRWVAVLPTAILSYVVSWLIYSSIFLAPFEDSDGIFRQIFELGVGLLASLIFVLAGSFTAPTSRTYVSIILAIIISMVAALFLKDTISNSRYSETMLVITTIIGAIIGCFDVIRNEHKRSLN